MLCAKPASVVTSTGSTQLVGCGDCENCRVNKKRAWVARILLEGRHAERSFREVSWTTMTYAEDSIPMATRGTDGEPLRTLRPLDYQLVFKRMRKLVGSFRFFLVGEYGDRTWRPHYHALIFGPKSVDVERALQVTWEAQFGHTRTRPWCTGETATGDFRLARARYLAGYVTKKMTQVDHRSLGERHPEFPRMSRNPGIGCTRTLLELMTTNGASQYIADTGDIPATVRLYGKQWPLARTVRDWVRGELGIPTRKADRLVGLDPEAHRPPVPTAADYARAQAQNEKLKRRYRAQTKVL